LATPDAEHKFRRHLAAVLKDLRQETHYRAEAMMMIGGLADRMISGSGDEDWPTLKHSLSRSAYARLLASRMTDPVTANANDVLDRVCRPPDRYFQIRRRRLCGRRTSWCAFRRTGQEISGQTRRQCELAQAPIAGRHASYRLDKP
jgi:hypothetical protein